jgi:hypothetical protein
MARSHLINPYLLAALVLVCAIGSGARAEQELLKIDINTSLNITYLGWEGWYPGGNTALRENTFSNGIKVAFFHPTDNTVQVGPRGNTNWGAFAGDSIELVDPLSGQGDIACTISYLSPGSYTLTTYHNEWQANSNMNVYQRIDNEPNTLTYSDIPQVHNVPNNEYVIANGAVPLSFTITQPGQEFTSMYITSFNFGLPDPNFADSNSYNVAICGFRLTANNIYAAYGPSPLPDSRIRANTTYNLQWNTPDPYEAGAQRYDLYFTTDPNELTDPGTGDPLFPAGKRLVTYADQSGRMSVACPALTTYTNYYWRVDSYGMKDANPDYKTVGMVWHFDTYNQAPTLELGANQVTVQGRQVTFTAVATDLDELPVGRTITYAWTWQNDPNDPNYTDAFGTYVSPFPATTPSVSFTLDPNDRLTGGGRTYTFNCEVSDGANTSNKDVLVTVYNKSLTNCEVIKKLASYQTAIRSAGDLNDDCITDLRDLSTYVMQWLACKAVNNVCP